MLIQESAEHWDHRNSSLVVNSEKHDSAVGPALSEHQLAKVFVSGQDDPVLGSRVPKEVVVAGAPSVFEDGVDVVAMPT